MPKPPRLIRPLLQYGPLVRRRMPEPLRIRHRLQRPEERPSEGFLERRRMAEYEVQVGHTARLILQNPHEKTWPPRLRPPFTAQLAYRGGARRV